MWDFSLADWSVLAGTVLTLVVLEGLLSADNALVLAVMVRPLPKNQQKRALRYGIIGAFAFRAIAVIFAATLLEYWIAKVLGGLYLLWLAVSHLTGGEEHHDVSKPRKNVGFWGTVLRVEIADIAFSIDSILAAVAMAHSLPPKLRDATVAELGGGVLDMELAVVYTGGILGIITMRYVAGYFIRLLDRFPGLASGAYWLVAWIGVKLVVGGLHNALHPKEHVEGTWRDALPDWAFALPELNEWVFWGGMFLILAVSLLFGRKKAGPIAAVSEGKAEPAVEVGRPEAD